jgi:hypothetical protein
LGVGSFSLLLRKKVHPGVASPERTFPGRAAAPPAGTPHRGLVLLFSFERIAVGLQPPRARALLKKQQHKPTTAAVRAPARARPGQEWDARGCRSPNRRPKHRLGIAPGVALQPGTQAKPARGREVNSPPVGWTWL